MKSRAVLGYSLMEVLVATLVLSAGVLGAAGLQLSAWRLTQQSTYHNSAHQLASELAEWLQLFEGARLDSLPQEKITADSSASASATHCYGRHCAADDFLNFIMEEWQRGLHAQLPDVEWRLCRDVRPWDDEASSYRWQCAGDENTAPLVIKIGWRDRRALEKPPLPQLVLNAGR